MRTCPAAEAEEEPEEEAVEDEAVLAVEVRGRGRSGVAKEATLKKPAAAPKSQPALKKPAAAGVGRGREVDGMSMAERLRLRPYGCSSCRHKPGCCPSCWK